eukprot:Hpha_TRINITY_DN9721_c0_g1::TRINITY_DN9721_c0_g1_i1::g.10425::m.10425
MPYALLAHADLRRFRVVQVTGRVVAMGRRVAVVVAVARVLAGGHHEATGHVRPDLGAGELESKNCAGTVAVLLGHLGDTLLLASGGGRHLDEIRRRRRRRGRVVARRFRYHGLVLVEKELLDDQLSLRGARKSEHVDALQKVNLQRLRLLPVTLGVEDRYGEWTLGGVGGNQQVLVHVPGGRVNREVVSASRVHHYNVTEGRGGRVHETAAAAEGLRAVNVVEALHDTDVRGTVFESVGSTWHGDSAIGPRGGRGRRVLRGPAGDKSIDLGGHHGGTDGPLRQGLGAVGGGLRHRQLLLVQHQRAPEPALAVARVRARRPARVHGCVTTRIRHPAAAKHLLVVGAQLAALRLEVEVQTAAGAPPAELPGGTEQHTPARRVPRRHGRVTGLRGTPGGHPEGLAGDTAEEGTRSALATGGGDLCVVTIADAEQVIAGRVAVGHVRVHGLGVAPRVVARDVVRSVVSHGLPHPHQVCIRGVRVGSVAHLEGCEYLQSRVQIAGKVIALVVQVTRHRVHLGDVAGSIRPAQLDGHSVLHGCAKGQSPQY